MLRPGDAVALSWRQAKARPSGGWTGDDLDSFMGFVEELRAVAVAHGAKLLLIESHPDLQPSYYSQPGNTLAPVTRQAARALAEPIASRVREMVESHATDVAYFESFDLFCSGTDDDSLCGEGVRIPGTTVRAYADATHLTNAAALYLWPWLCEGLQTSAGLAHLYG